MPIKIRPHPAIPDHEVLRKIGGGSYGEVWLARGVTGALRAVKVVWREDFDDERSFEREFEGILKFEPLSRDHPGLVHVLHVGRSPDSKSFYYYVMELGDDMTSGQDINPVEYEPRTLRADNQQGAGLQWPTDDCIDVGLRLAEALQHLHEHGLAHRDVKPSNVIFVNGKAKLADIGLVAARGQRTFVGTEGFVPPEGPGTAQADVYGLGKVLYEIATGKDRFSFPELPDSVPGGTEGKRWLGLNRIICDTCDPRVAKRSISTAAEMADALRRLQVGKKRKRRFPVSILTVSLLLFTGVVTWFLVMDKVPALPQNPLAQQPAELKRGVLRIVSAPEQAEVENRNGEIVGITPLDFTVTANEEYSYTIKKSGYLPMVIQGKVPANFTELEPLFFMLKEFSPPQPNEKWKDPFGNSYDPFEQAHRSARYVKKEEWQKFTKEEKLASKAEFYNFSQSEKPEEIVLAAPGEALAYCLWFQRSAVRDGFLSDDHEVVPLLDAEFSAANVSERAQKESLRPLHLLVRQVPYGEITVSIDHQVSEGDPEPPGTEIYIAAMSDPTKRVLAGVTGKSLTIPKLKPGNWQLYIVCEGYQPLKVDVKVGENERVAEDLLLEKSRGIIFGKRSKNGLGMLLEPINEDLMASAWETRVKDYAVFAKETGRGQQYPTDFEQTPEHPVVNVSRDDAQAFCNWLTERERQSERIAQIHIYRLPTDLEWSEMAGITEDAELSPSWRHARKQKTYPWGDLFPPQAIVGNFADMTAVSESVVVLERSLENYNDGYAHTSPVGSFPESSKRLFDISGNVQEWVSDDYSKVGKSPLGVLRGGSWNSYQSENLTTGFRNALPATFRDSIYGFRVVLAKVPPKLE